MRGIKLDNSLQKSSGPGAPLSRILSSSIIMLPILGLYLCLSGSQNGLIFPHTEEAQLTDLKCLSIQAFSVSLCFYSYFV